MSYENWPIEAKRQMVARARARLEERLAAERQIVNSLSPEERAVYRLAVLRRILSGVAARKSQGECEKAPMSGNERTAKMDAIIEATSKAIAVRDALARESRLEAVLSSLQQWGLIAPELTVDSLRLDKLEQ